jgi:hypothetical protein
VIMILLTLLVAFSAVLPCSLALGEHEDSCGIYPRCEQYGAGVWQILEDCHKYINCTRVNGELIQQNLECPGDLVYAEEYGECVDYNWATECKIFQNTPCFASCPRRYMMSSGNGLEYQERRLGCFRLSGTMLGYLAHYQNMNAQYLAPDSASSTFLIHWLVSERFGALMGGIRNERDLHLQCPYTGWNSGWQVDKGLGNWVEDNTITTTCYRGNEDTTTHAPVSTTSASPASSTTAAQTTTKPTPTTTATTRPPPTTTASTTTAEPSECVVEGANSIGDCIPEFNCCHKDNGSWKITKCSCENTFVFSEDFGMCTWADTCFKEELDVSLYSPSHHCEDNSLCY